jgi:hypothetical protein
VRCDKERLLWIALLPNFMNLDLRVCTRNCSVLHTQYCSGDEIEKNEMGGACSAYWGKERRMHDFGGET